MFSSCQQKTSDDVNVKTTTDNNRLQPPADNYLNVAYYINVLLQNLNLNSYVAVKKLR